MTAALVLTGVTRRYLEHVGVFDLDLSVEPGESVCLLGPSGCGKTTLLRIIAGLVAPDAGRVAIGGADVTAVPAYARDIGMVFQSWALFAHQTVLRNVEFGLAMRRVPRAERRRRAGAMLDLVGLAALADRRPRQLSGGQQQRVALARALAIQPRLLLLDEPLSSLDHNTRVELRRELRDLQRRVGVTSIHVTHDYGDALATADRTVLMRAGRIVEQGETHLLFAQPATEYAARFLGLHNLVPALCARDGAAVQATLPGGQAVRMPAGGGPDEGAVLLCFDPWTVTLADAAGPGTVAATLQGCVPEHGCTRITATLPDGTAVALLRPGLERMPAGGAMHLAIDWGRVRRLRPERM